METRPEISQAPRSENKPKNPKLFDDFVRPRQDCWRNHVLVGRSAPRAKTLGEFSDGSSSRCCFPSEAPVVFRLAPGEESLTL
jgi:hypothetical protein